VFTLLEERRFLSLRPKLLDQRRERWPEDLAVEQEVIEPYAERIAWLARRKAGLEYSLDVHDPVLRLASAALPPAIRSMPSPSPPSSRWYC
jgi:hypothetical protein